MSINNGDSLAYPISESQHVGFSANNEKIYTTVVNGGLTKREIFAMAAMQGILANPVGGYPVKDAIRYADELLEQLESNTADHR